MIFYFLAPYQFKRHLKKSVVNIVFYFLANYKYEYIIIFILAKIKKRGPKVYLKKWIMASKSLKNLSELKISILYDNPIKTNNKIDLSESNILDQVEIIKKILSNLNSNLFIIPITNQILNTIDNLLFHGPDIVFNLCESVHSESCFEMNIPSILEFLGITYTGSSPLALGLCQQKDLTKSILMSNNIPTPRYKIIQQNDEILKLDLKFPLIIKPVHEDGSLGITEESIVSNYREINRQIKYISDNFHQPALIEEYIDGREFNVSILGNYPPIVLPISEIMFKGEKKIVDYDSKWVYSSKSFKESPAICPAIIDSKILYKIKKIAIKSYKALHCRDYARVDIRLYNETPYVIDVNPNPDISSESGYIRSIKAGGLEVEEFIKAVVSYAVHRKNNK